MRRVDELPMEVVYFIFDMPNFVVGNYTPVAVIEHGLDEEGNFANVIHKLDDGLKVPKEWYNIPGHCDDCKDKYSRKKTVMLLNNDDLTFRQIGTSCLKKYLGINCYNVINNFVNTEEYIIDKSHLYVDDPLYKANLSNFVDTEKYLGCVLDVIFEKGSRIKYFTTEEAYKRVKNPLYKPTEKSAELVEKIRSYFAECDISKLNNFESNVVSICIRKHTKVNEIILWFYDVYRKLTDKEKKAKENLNSEFVGNVGDSIEVKIKVINNFAFESRYGLSYLHVFKDVDTGNVYTWTTSTKCVTASDTVYNIKGKIKDHKEYNGVKQTVLTIVKFSELN